VRRVRIVTQGRATTERTLHGGEPEAALDMPAESP
jgi:hypothetical protein